MKKWLLSLLLIPLIFVAVSGCAPFIIGGAVGAVGGYAVSKDTVRADTDSPYDKLWDSTLSIAKIRGNIKQQDYAKGYVESEADSSRVWIRLIRLTRATNRIKVSCRKYHLPNLSLAQDMLVKIIDQAK